MRLNNRWLAVILLIFTGLPLAACGSKSASTSSKTPAAKVEEIDNSELNRLTLTEKAAERLGIQTAPIREEQVSGTQRTVVPYAAVVYDTEGGAWVFTEAEPLIFIRQAVTLGRVEGDIAVLMEGPPPGTEVVTVGVAELYGLDTGVGK